MVMPISPNTQHQRGRVPISSEPPFPFSNCFFWIESSMSLRVRVGKRGEREYNNRESTALPTRQNILLGSCFNDDKKHIGHLLHQKQAADTPDEAQSSRPVAMTSASPSFVMPPPLPDVSMITETLRRPPIINPQTQASNPDALSSLVELNIFGWDPDPQFQFIPHVDVWLNLEQSISESEIPSPVELWKEQDCITS